MITKSAEEDREFKAVTEFLKEYAVDESKTTKEKK